VAAAQPASFKQRATIGRADLAARLHQLADQVAQGRLTFDQGPVSLPEQIEFQLEFEAKREKRELSLELEWR